jgi:hypothetical protein
LLELLVLMIVDSLVLRSVAEVKRREAGLVLGRDWEWTGAVKSLLRQAHIEAYS